VTVHRAVLIRARGLKVGSYRITIHATDRSGRPAAAIRLRLRVR
jgi:hypothetical protein